MIDEVHIKNFALLEDCTINFNDNFNILSGETGSGKSLIAASLAMLHGVKGDIKWIRTGCDECQVSGSFYVQNQKALDWLEEHGITADESSVLVRRTLKKNGRGSIQIQGNSVTRDELCQFVSIIFDIHGQHEQYTLLNSQNQLQLLDQYAQNREDLEVLHGNFEALSRLRREIDAAEKEQQSLKQQTDIMEFTVREIEDAKLKSGEEDILEQKLQVLSKHDRLIKLVEEVVNNLNGNGAVQMLRDSRGLLASAGKIDAELESLASRLENAFYEIEDIVQTLNDYILKDNYDSQQLSVCEERLALIGKLKKKYGFTIDDVLSYWKKTKEKLENIVNFNFNQEKMCQKAAVYEKQVVEISKKISEKRREAAKVLSKRIEDVLHELGMSKTVFSIDVNVRKNENGKISYSSSGMDNVVFMISPNAGEPMRPLNTAISGGELSRIMLAVKSAFAGTDPVETLFFDEIDTGIGGEIAVKIGKYLKLLSEYKQVICITHLASIAVNADNHIKVEKIFEAERTFTKCHILDDDARTHEIARMLSGTDSDISLEHAREMIEKSKG